MIQNNQDFIRIFEEKIANYTAFKYAVCVDCCTNAILLCCEMLNRFKLIDKKNVILTIPKQTYMSIPMTLKNHNWKIQFIDNKWKKFYQIGSTNIFDAATDFHENMKNDFNTDALVCISFQQKKRLSLGRGGAILLNDKIKYDYLKRLCYDGRNAFISDNKEINKNPNDIICGYHCYMEPDKAAVGILKMNQINLLSKYVEHTYLEYEDLTKLNIW